jgi:iron complex transport system substrate-binding protein
VFSGKLRSQAAVAVSALVLATGLAACGDSAAGSGSASGSQASSSGEGGFPRVVKHHKGETKLATKPKRIVALDNSLVEAVVAFEQPLVGGIGSYRDLKGFPPYLGDAVRDTKDVGPLESPNLEAVAALEPDLIVSATVRHDALYDELSAIAPTVFVETSGPIWKDNIRKLGEATGDEKKADEVLAAYELRAATIGKAINEKAGDPTFSITRFLDGPTRLMGNKSFIGIVLSDMGIARPKDQNIDDFAVEIGEEQIRKADGDHIFVTTFSGGQPAKERFLHNPLWKQLEAVKAGNVHDVEDAIWMTSVSVQGAHLILDDLAKLFEVGLAKS